MGIIPLFSENVDNNEASGDSSVTPPAPFPALEAVPAVPPPTITTPINSSPPAKQQVQEQKQEQVQVQVEEEQLSAEERRVLIGHLEGQEGLVLTARQQLALLQERKFRDQGFQPFSSQSDNQGRFRPDQPRSQQGFEPQNQRFQPQQQQQRFNPQQQQQQLSPQQQQQFQTQFDSQQQFQPQQQARQPLSSPSKGLSSFSMVCLKMNSSSSSTSSLS